MKHDPHTTLIAQELAQRGYRVHWLHRWSITTVIHGQVVAFWSTRSPLNSQIAGTLARRKDVANKILQPAGVPIPEGHVFSKKKLSAAEEYASGRWPLVVKPAHSPGGGKGATVNVSTLGQLRKSFSRAGQVSSWVMVQQQVRGFEARMLVIGGKCVSVLQKMSQPGEYEAITDRVHPTYINMAEQAVAAFPGLGLAGLDVIAEDWSRPGECAVIEVNSAPGIVGHHHPKIGPSFDAAGAIVDELEKAQK